MTTLTVTTKGQGTFRKDVLVHLDVQPGDKITADKFPGGRIEIKATRPSGRISDVFGILKQWNGPSLSIDQIDHIITEGWAGKR